MPLSVHQACRPGSCTKQIVECLLLFGVDQFQQLEVTSNASVGHGDTDVFEVLLQREQTSLVAERDEPSDVFRN